MGVRGIPKQPPKNRISHREALKTCVLVSLHIKLNGIDLISDDFMWDAHDTNIQKMRYFAKTLVDQALHEQGDTTRQGLRKVIAGDQKITINKLEEIIDAIALTIRREVQIWWFIQPQVLAKFGFFGSAFGGLGQFLVPIYLEIEEYGIFDEFEWDVANLSNSPQLFAQHYLQDFIKSPTSKISESQKQKILRDSKTLGQSLHQTRAELALAREIRHQINEHFMTSVLQTCEQRREFYSRIKNYLDYDIPPGLQGNLETFSQQIDQKVKELRKKREEQTVSEWKKSKYRGNSKAAAKAIMVPFINQIREPKVEPNINALIDQPILQCLPYPVSVKMNQLKVGNVSIPIESLLKQSEEPPQVQADQESHLSEGGASVKSRKVENVFMLENQSWKNQLRQKSQNIKRANEIKRINYNERKKEIVDLQNTLAYLKEEVTQLEAKKQAKVQRKEGEIVISLSRGYNAHRRLTYKYLGTTQNGVEVESISEQDSDDDDDQTPFPSFVESEQENKIKIMLVDQENHQVMPQLGSSWKQNFEKAKAMQDPKQHLWETKSSARNGKGKEEEESEFIPSEESEKQEAAENTKILINLSNLDVKIK